MTTPPPTVGWVSPQGVTRQDTAAEPEADVGLREANPTYGAEWKNTTIGEICTRVFSGGTPTSTNPANYEGGTIPWLRTKEVNYSKIYGTEQNITERGFESSSAKLVPLNSVIVAMYGNGDTAGRVAINKVPLTTNQACCNLVVDEKQADYRFVYYYLMGQYKTLVELKNGGAQQNLNGQLIKAFPIALPSLAEQAEISAFLESLDDRITLLRETNATLEAIAQALFKSWFVDFDPVRAKQQGLAPEGMIDAMAAMFPDGFEESELGLVPRGWHLAPLSEAFEINPSRKLKKGEHAPYLDMASVGTLGHVVSGTIQREMGSGSKFVNGDTLLARITPCLENGKTAFLDCLPEGQTGWGSTEFIVLRPRAPLPPYFGYLLCRHKTFRDFAIQSMSGTSGRQRIQNDVLGRFLVAIPSPEVAAAFGLIVGGVQQRIAANHAQAQTLATLRDTLLPRLISGQLRLPEAQAELEGACP